MILLYFCQMLREGSWLGLLWEEGDEGGCHAVFFVFVKCLPVDLFADTRSCQAP